jgi:hypothetical protein
MSRGSVFPGLPFLAATALLVAGCAQFVKPVPPPPDPPGRYVLLTQPFIAFGDTQEHEVTGFPLHNNDGAVDAFVEVAQRPPEQPLFGRRILEWVIVNNTDDPFVHLGDLLDMSCRSELARMAAVFAAARQPGALLPGNHDGLMFGIFNSPVVAEALEDSGHAWYRGCVRGADDGGREGIRNPRESAVDRRTFLATYLSYLAAYPRVFPGLPAAPMRGEARLSWRNPDPEVFLAGIEARLADETSYANSFIVQKLRPPAAPGAPRRVTIIGLDTNQVDAIVGSLDAVREISPGSIGHVRGDQLRAAAPWIEEARRAGDIVVFAGHHNWNSLSFGSQARLGALMATLDHPLVYISAHTHRGFWARHSIGTRPLLELNVSSLSDWPLAYRRIRFAYDAPAQRLQVHAEILPNLGATPQDDLELLRAWESLTCTDTGFSAAALEESELQVVKGQRDARGTLVDWLVQGLGEWCAPCLQGQYQSGLRYQDALLETLDGLYRDFADTVPAVRNMRSPAACQGAPLPVCSAQLRGRQAEGLEATIALFRERARFIDSINNQLDRINDPRVRNYMVCRAVIAARADYDLTSVERRGGRDETERRALHFFRIEATVGMQ